jgi:hypothetical protein
MANRDRPAASAVTAVSEAGRTRVAASQLEMDSPALWDREREAVDR